jgi:hypothetical protein
MLKQIYTSSFIKTKPNEMSLQYVQADITTIIDVYNPDKKEFKTLCVNDHQIRCAGATVSEGHRLLGDYICF